MRHDPRDMVDFLNELLRLDPHAMGELMGTHVKCNKDLADHPSVQVTAEDRPRVGLLGLVNGYLGHKRAQVVMLTDADDREKIRRFVRASTEPCPPDLAIFSS